ncbi:unnamed protein product [Prorocentrum cordatum]|uniref:BioF2-like acetyltransferase domain-containing protein n=1 Tax=Prorocentrum cordatum TaxID=2364126 RepID=A0ABN9USQ6_9DINO|nr:unnamed protein product [Polarella glacialis]
MAVIAAAEKGADALRRQFPHVELETISLFVESCGEALDAESVEALVEMQAEAQKEVRFGQPGFYPTRECEAVARERADDWRGAGTELALLLEGGGDPPRVGTVLLISGLEAFEAACVAVPDGQVFALAPQAPPARFLVSEYGMHELRVIAAGGKVLRCHFMSTSQLGDFAEAMDHFHDACDWVWDGKWTDELEAATMGMLVELDDYFSSLDAAMARSPLGETLKSEIGPSRRRLEACLAKALEHQDAQSVGRIYSGVRSFLHAQGVMNMLPGMLGGGLGMGPLRDSGLYRSVLAFERERFAAASSAKQAEVRSALTRLIETADAHAAELEGGSSTDFPKRWRSGLRSTLVEMLEDPEAVIHPLPFQQLRGGDEGHIAEMMRGVMESMGSSGSKVVRRSDTIEGISAINPDSAFEEVDAKVSRWDESFVDEAITFGSPMHSFEVHGAEPCVETVMAAIQNILSLGLAYVTQGANDAPTSKLIALMGRDRATLPLSEYDEFLQDRRRRDRLKDVCRVVRAVRKKGQRLALTVNTDFEGTLKALKEHHGDDNWVGASLEAVWRKMAEQGRAFAFELWLHGADGAAPRLIAADFGHPHTHGLAYYVTTRFFDREFRTIQPGFILAFAEAECMRRAGVELWDLGGADKSPMMSYKPQVAIEMGRSGFLRRLRECRLLGDRAASEAAAAAGAPPPEQRGRLALRDGRAAPPGCGDRIPTGVVFEDITEAELWGTAVLQAHEEQLKAQQEAAKQAAKKIQKPSKASRKAQKQPQQAAVAQPEPGETRPGASDSGAAAAAAAVVAEPLSEAAAAPAPTSGAAAQPEAVAAPPEAAAAQPEAGAAPPSAPDEAACAPAVAKVARGGGRCRQEGLPGARGQGRAPQRGRGAGAAHRLVQVSVPAARGRPSRPSLARAPALPPALFGVVHESRLAQAWRGAP